MSFHPVATHVEDASPAVCPCRTGEETPVAPEDPALTVMADFHWICPVTVAPEQKIDVALQNMMAAGVRALLVMQGEQMIGLITSWDI